jgi:hypothetical protein
MGILKTWNSFPRNPGVKINPARQSVSCHDPK